MKSTTTDKTRGTSSSFDSPTENHGEGKCQTIFEEYALYYYLKLLLCFSEPHYIPIQYEGVFKVFDDLKRGVCGDPDSRRLENDLHGKDIENRPCTAFPGN